MKLYAEQIDYLRKRKSELLNLMADYSLRCADRESGDIEGFGAPHFFDYQDVVDNHHHRNELDGIDHMLKNSEIRMEREYDMIDIGTAFYVKFDDGFVDRMMLVDAGTNIVGLPFYASVDSDFGKAVFGKKKGDHISYTVTSTGTKINISIEDIDQIKDHYLHFIREKKYTERVCTDAAREIRKMKEENSDEYQKIHAITPSQVELLKEELFQVKGKDLRRSNFIIKQLTELPVIDVPTGKEIQVGSIVDVTLQDGQNEPKTHHFELINRAVSTEINNEYVERISPLGNAIYGLQTGESFIVRRRHLPAIKGVVTNVQNCDVKERVK